ncbi:MAG: VOC family protein [Vicinamibacterales bacterium]|nr:VOC family protein [Vicinamibacterales bacterium]
MRACMLFVTGLLVGVGLHTVAAQSGDKGPNTGLVAMNHVAISVPNFDETLNYYTKTLGFPQAFLVKNPDGKPRLAYVQISKNTFVEISPGMPGVPASYNHFGIHVEKMAPVVEMFKARGAKVVEGNVSPTNAVLANITDLNGLRIELAELPPNSLHRQAMDRWK